MAANELRITGLAELRAALLKLPPALVQEAGVIVHAQAEAMAHAVESQYPVRTGNLRGHVQVELASDGVSATARVKNTARTKDGKRDLGHIYEKGTPPRRWASGKSTGQMPAGKVFIPIAIMRRRIMMAALVDLIQRAGLTVTGSAP
jgi:hypothetical protein